MVHTKDGVRGWRRAVAPLAFAAFAVASSAAAEVTVSSTEGSASAAPEIAIGDGKVEIALDAALALALERNLGLRVQRYTRSQSWYGILQNRGIYDFQLAGDVSVLDNTSAQVSQIQASALKQQTWNLGLSRLLPTGATASTRFENSRTETDVVFQSLNPEFNSILRLRVQQPLLRDFGRASTERGLRIARVSSAIARSEFETQVVSIVQQVTGGYWNLVAARDQLKVAEQSLALARELHERNKIQVDVGTMAPLELVQSEAAIATREEGIIRAQAAVGDAADQLRQLLDLPVGEAWTAEIVPTTVAETERVTIDVDDAIATALSSRPEIRAQQGALERLAIDSSYYRGQKKPRLDLDLGYRLNGTGGKTNTPPVVNGGWTDALQQVTDLDFRGWSAGLTFSLPLENRAAKAQSVIADLALDQGKVGFEQVKTQITTEVRTAARAVETAAKQIDAARLSVKFQERNLDAEKKRYENGMSTSYRINQIQDDLTQARSREVAAVVTYRTSLAAFYKATGRLLEQESVKIEDPEGEPLSTPAAVASPAPAAGASASGSER